MVKRQRDEKRKEEPKVAEMETNIQEDYYVDELSDIILQKA